MAEDLYDVLGVDDDADEEELRRAYRQKAREYHPDRADADGARRRFTLVNKAHEVLSDPTERSAYDRLGHEEYVATRGSSIPPLEPEDGGGTDDAGTSGDRSEAGGSAGRSGRSGSTDRSTRSGATDRSTSDGSASTTGPGSSGRSESTRDRTDDGRSGGSTDRGTGPGASTTDRSAESTTGGGSSPGSATGADGSAASGGASASSGSAATGGASASSASATGSASVTGGAAERARRRGLRRAYVAVLAAALAYGVGLAAYAAAAGETLRTRLLGLTTVPLAAATTASPFPPAAGFLTAAGDAAAAGAPTAAAGLGLAVGAVALPTALIATVARYGRGEAWLYALPALLPAAALAGGSALGTAPLWVDLLALVVAPAAATAAFCVDVGRYLLATR